MMKHTIELILIAALVAGCNTFAEAESFEQTDATSNATTPDSGAPDASTSDAGTSTDGGASHDGGEPDGGPPATDLELTAPTVATFVDEHELQTSVALIRTPDDSFLVSLAYRHDPVASRNDGFVLTKGLDADDYNDATLFSWSGNGSFKGIDLIRDPAEDTKLLASANYDGICATTMIVQNSSHRYGGPEEMQSVSATQECTNAGTTIRTLGNIVRFESVDDTEDVRYGFVTEEMGKKSLETNTPVNSSINYTSIELPRTNGHDQAYAAPGLIATFNQFDSSIFLWSGLAGTNPNGWEADPATTAVVALESAADLVALSGTSPSRYEAWLATDSELKIFNLPCEVDFEQLGHLECESANAQVSQSVAFDGEIVGLAATRAGRFAMASVLARASNGRVDRHLVVYDGSTVERFEVGPSLGDLVRAHASTDVYQVSESRRIVAFAATYLRSAPGSRIETQVATFEVLSGEE